MARNAAIHKKVSEGTISRLYVYLREAAELARLNIRTISSAELGERTNLSAAQVRKDLSHFGQFGRSGAGYDIGELKSALEKILGKNRIWNVAVVGVGQLGSALLSYPGFKARGLSIVAAFDSDTRKAGRRISNITVQPMARMSKEVLRKNISIGIITVPSQNAQGAANDLIDAGIECILNFAPASLIVPDNIKVKNVDFSRELETLSYFLAKRKS